MVQEKFNPNFKGIFTHLLYPVRNYLYLVLTSRVLIMDILAVEIIGWSKKKLIQVSGDFYQTAAFCEKLFVHVLSMDE